MKKKFRSKWFRVAVEGATTDKRVIKRSWIEQCAKNFNSETYGARVWLEHFRSLLPDGPFRAYGDVVGLKAEEVEINGQKKLALFAMLEPTEDLIALNKARQKIYTSAEIDEQFADSNEAYLVGLAVTDSPASLGTEVLAFSAQKPEASPFNGRHYSDTAMFTEATETELTFEEVDEVQPSLGKKLFAKVDALLGKYKASENANDQRFDDVHAAVTALAEHSSAQAEAFSALQTSATQQQETIVALRTDLDALKAEHKKFSATLDKIPNGDTKRPPASGGDGIAATDC